MQIDTSDFKKWLRLESDSFIDRKDGYFTVTLKLDTARIDIPTKLELENKRFEEINIKDKKTK